MTETRKKCLRETARQRLISEYGISASAIDRAEVEMTGQIILAAPEGKNEFHAFHLLAFPVDDEMLNMLVEVTEFEDEVFEKAIKSRKKDA